MTDTANLPGLEARLRYVREMLNQLGPYYGSSYVEERDALAIRISALRARLLWAPEAGGEHRPLPDMLEVVQRLAALERVIFHDPDDPTSERVAPLREVRLDLELAAAKAAMRAVVAGWEALPGGEDHSPAVIGRWLILHMKPAVDGCRVMLPSPQEARDDRAE